MTTRRGPDALKRGSDEDEENLLQAQSGGIKARVAAYNADVVDSVSPPTWTFLYSLLALLTLLILALGLVNLHPPSSTSSPSSSPSSSSSSSLPASIPEWVVRYRVEHLFHYTWLRTSNHSAYQAHMRNHPHGSFPTIPPSPSLPPSFVVNDALSYLYSHPAEGVVLDFTPQLPNPDPHPLPITRSWPSTCSDLHLLNDWATCKQPQSELNHWLPATTHALTMGVFDAYVDVGSCNGEVPGTVFSLNATFHMQRWTNSPCYNSPIDLAKVHQGPVRHYEELIDTVGTYGAATGHFAPQQLPRIIRSLALCPPTAKLLVSHGGVANPLMDVLVERGLVERSRLVPFESAGLYHADVVYRSESWPYLTDKYNHYAHDRTDMQLVHRTLVDDLPEHERDLVILIRRGKGAARSLADHTQLLDNLTAALAAPPLSALGLRAVSFDASGHIRDHIALFRRAKVLIGPHGAGMINLYWLHPGSHVMEVGYDEGMVFPEMYAEMAMHSDHAYYVVKGKGSYDGEIHLDWDDFMWAWNTAVTALTHDRKGNKG